jgi:hypothetical protein
VLVIGCELTLFNPGYLPGTFFYDRIRRLARPGPRQLAAFARLPKRLNGFLAGAAEAVRSGRVVPAADRVVDFSQTGPRCAAAAGSSGCLPASLTVSTVQTVQTVELRGEQPPVPLGDDFDGTVDHPDGGLIVDRVRRHGQRLITECIGMVTRVPMGKS